MKSTALLLALCSLPSFAGTTYDCGDLTAIVMGPSSNPVVKLTYKKDPSDRPIHSDQMQEGDQGYGDSSLKDPVNFNLFKYDDGEQYFEAEGQTNEEGFSFIAERGLLSGKPKVKAVDIYWSDFHYPEVHHYTCVKK